MNCEDCPFVAVDDVEGRLECYQKECIEEISNTESE
jgi:hypothetical protein